MGWPVGVSFMVVVVVVVVVDLKLSMLSVGSRNEWRYIK